MFSYSLLLCLIPAIIECYPFIDTELKPQGREEKTLANGTVLGKYSYLDREGNPILVKYYADNAGYGVELKSLKMEGDGKYQQFSSQEAKLEFLSTEPTNASALEFDNPESAEFNLPETENKYKVPADFFDENTAKTHAKEGKSTGFDTSQNDLTAPKVKKCRKDKVRSIFYNKAARKARKAFDIYKEGMPGVCQQF